MNPGNLLISPQILRTILPRIKKSPARNVGLFFRLAHHCDVASLRTLGALFYCELDLLALLQVAEPITLNGGEMDEHVLSAFALDEAEAFVTVEPLDCTSYSVRHCICLLWQDKNLLGVLFVPSEGKTKQPAD